MSTRLSSVVIMFEVFCDQQVTRIRDVQPITFGPSRRIKRNIDPERPSSQTTQVLWAQIRKAHRGQ